MERPKRTEDYILKAAAEKLAVDLIEWGASTHVALTACEQLVRQSSFMNAYELAKEFEQLGFDPDLQCVEKADQACRWISDINRYGAALTDTGCFRFDGTGFTLQMCRETHHDFRSNCVIRFLISRRAGHIPTTA